jgi:hypothetical protein
MTQGEAAWLAYQVSMGDQLDLEKLTRMERGLS